MPGGVRKVCAGGGTGPLTLGLYSHFRNLCIIAAPARPARRPSLHGEAPGPGCGGGPRAPGGAGQVRSREMLRQRRAAQTRRPRRATG